MLKQLVMTLSYVNGITLLIPIGVGIFRWKALSMGLRAGWAAIVSYFLLFVLSLAMIGQNTLLIHYLIAALFGGLFALAYWYVTPLTWQRFVIAGMGIVGIGSIAIEAFVLNHTHEVSKWSVPLQTVLTTLTVLIFLQYLIRGIQVNLLKIPFFWISVGLLISSVLGTIYDAFRHQMMASSRDLLLTWLSFQLCITIFCNLLYGVGFNLAKSTTD